jgi:hypothetical protein
MSEQESLQITQPEANADTEQVSPPSARRPGVLRRIGFWIVVVFWFALIMLPCGLFTLATQGQIVVRTGELTEQEVRVWLIMEAQTRGLGVSSGVVSRQTETQLCIETTANYLLWAGRERANVYCNCYVRASADQPWRSDSALMEACPAQ